MRMIQPRSPTGWRESSRLSNSSTSTSSALQAQQGDVQQKLAALQAQLAQSTAELAPLPPRRRRSRQASSPPTPSWQAINRPTTSTWQLFRTDVRKVYELGGMRWFEFVFAARSFDDLLEPHDLPATDDGQ